MATAQNEALAQRESSQLTATPWTYGRARLPPTLATGGDRVEITAELIAAAERILGVSYTDAERSLMVDNLAAQAENARQRRVLVFPNNLAPALRFDPRPPGFRAPAPQSPVRWSEDGPDNPPGDDESIAFSPVAHLSRWIRNRSLSSARLTEIYLSRMDAFADRLECYVTVAADRARPKPRPWTRSCGRG